MANRFQTTVYLSQKARHVLEAMAVQERLSMSRVIERLVLGLPVRQPAPTLNKYKDN